MKQKVQQGDHAEQSVYGHSFRTHSPMPFEAELLLLTKTHPLYRAPLLVDMPHLNRTMGSKVLVDTYTWRKPIFMQHPAQTLPEQRRDLVTRFHANHPTLNAIDMEALFNYSFCLINYPSGLKIVA
jgi:hypothetical protein